MTRELSLIRMKKILTPIERGLVALRSGTNSIVAHLKTKCKSFVISQVFVVMVSTKNLTGFRKTRIFSISWEQRVRQMNIIRAQTLIFLNILSKCPRR